MSDGSTRPDPFPIEPFPGPVDADVSIPGSKSITNRALICAALAQGTSTLDGVLFADDTEAMLDCLDRLGVGLTVDRARAKVEVRGLAGILPAGPVDLDARMSGTTARFLLPVLALGPGPYRLDGHPALRARPMADGIGLLHILDVHVDAEGAEGHLPVTISGRTHSTSMSIPGSVSSQFVSGALLAAPACPGGQTIGVDGMLVSPPYVAMTVAVMEAFRAVVHPLDRPNTFRVEGRGYRATDTAIEPDASAASYAFAAAVITGGRVRVPGLDAHSLQGDLGFVRVLEQMGATVEQGTGFTEVRGSGALHGVTVDLAELSDTAQTLAAVAVFADSPTEVTGIGFIRQKETDRIAAVVSELRRCGVDATETADGFRIVPSPPRPTVIQTYDDHRMAMSFALLGLRAPGIAIADPGCVAKTFPGYWDLLDQLRTRSAGRD